jgi:hypothetical protein
MNKAETALPENYRQATWRNTTKKDELNQCIGVGFDLSGGDTVRLSLSVECARNLAETLNDYLSIDHSPSSSGMPSNDVSMPLAGKNV